MSYLIALIGTLSLLVASTAWADFEEGVTAYLQGDYDSAYDELRPLAAQGNAKAQFIIGRMYANGTPVPQSDTEAVRWYRLSAEQGYSSAQDSLASMYFYGYGVPQDYLQAVGWWQKAAEQGHSDAQATLGYIYLNGKEIGREIGRASCRERV